jgi:tRNA A58 N-methylase Trm61
MVAFRSGTRPSGKKAREDVKRQQETEKSEKKIIKGRKIIEKKSGERIELKAGSKGCKLAMKGKGRAYGKNS